MVWPSACAANIKQDRTAAPSNITVQAPHTPCSQPTCVPASNKSWRRKSLSSIRASTWRRYGVPFTVTVMACASVSWASVATLRPLIRCSQGARGQDAGDMALILLAGVHVAARIDLVLDERGCRLDLRRGDLAAGKRLARLRGEDRPVAGIAEADPRLATASVRIELHRAGDADDGEVAAPARNLDETGSRAGRRDR